VNLPVKEFKKSIYFVDITSESRLSCFFSRHSVVASCN